MGKQGFWRENSNCKQTADKKVNKQLTKINKRLIKSKQTADKKVNKHPKM